MRVKRARRVPTEHQEQRTFFEWLEVVKPTGWLNCFAIPNGANKSRASAGKFKAEGLRSGVPDVFYSYPSGGYHGLYIEMKRVEGGRVEENQKKWIERLRRSGYAVVVCKGSGQAIEAVERYLALNDHLPRELQAGAVQRVRKPDGSEMRKSS